MGLRLDSYECQRCKEWSHYEQGEAKRLPEFCPYCGDSVLRWRTDNNWTLSEVMT